MNWTDDQKLAITTRGGKVIVSAAAGSGKTAVLSARIIDYILKGGSVDKLLVVTFTTLAAGEMKERIKKNINDALMKDPSNTHLQEQTLLVDLAQIMTMDAFYNKLIKENFMYLNISPDFSVIDEIEYKILKYDVAKSLVEELLENNSKIIELLDNFCNYKDGTTIEELLISFNDYINKLPNPSYWLDKLPSIHDVDDISNSIWSNILYSELTDDIEGFKNLYLDMLEEIKLDDVLFEKLNDFTNNEMEPFDKIIKAIKNNDIENLISLISSFDMKTYPRIKDYADHPTSVKFKNIRNELKKTIKDYNNVLKYNDTFKDDQKSLNLIINELIYVTKIYRTKLQKIRKENNFYSFDDIPHLVIKLLVKDYNFETGKILKTDIAKNLEDMFDEILIDEFQDTNLVQNLIFSSLSKNDTNLFIVGDVKQSIYGFRSARPDLLINEKNNASKQNFPKLINLSQNFRSRKEVLDFSNYLFSKIMSDTYGDITYDENECLNLGAKYLENENNSVELQILTELSEKDEEEDITNQEKEAVVVTNKIKELFASNYQVFDSKTNMYRPLLKSDIAILLRSPGEFGNILRDTLVSNGIDVYTEKTPVYFNNYEIKLIIALLKIIDNPYDEISLTSVLRSPIFEIESSLLMEVRNFNKSDNLYNNLFKMQNNSKIQNFLKKYKDYQLKSYSLNINKLLNYIYNDTKILAIISSFDNGEKHLKNLLEMVNHSNNYLENNTNSLHDFIVYIDTLIDNDYSLEGVNPATEKDSVLITTIHKSKGLEFPIVILPRLDKKFNFDDLSQTIILDNDYYLGLKLRNHELYNVNSNLIFELIKMNVKNKQLSEELRVLYVALTRAKEKLIMTGVVKNLEKKITYINSLAGNTDVIYLNYLKTSKSMLDFILPVVMKHYNSKELREMANIDTKVYNDSINLKTYIKDLNDIIIDKKEVIKLATNDVLQNDIYDVLEYKYPYQGPNYKVSLSVSELNKQGNFILKPSFITPNKQLTVGTVYHKILEHLELIDYDFNSFKEAINNLVDIHKLTSSDVGLINLNKIFNYFNDPLYLTVIKNSNHKKEYPISFTIKVKELDKKSNLEDELVVDGIIDLFLKKDDTYYIIDYKSDVVDNEQDLIDRYKKQLDLYEYALIKKTNGKVLKYLYSIHLSKFIKL